MTVTIDHKNGKVRLIQQPDGAKTIEVYTSGASKPDKKWTTSYHPDLIRAVLDAKGPAFLCDEIRRDEDPRYTPGLLNKSILAYFNKQYLNGKRILDFGCGSGASAMVLKRMFPQAHIVGVERSAKLLKIAELRTKHYGFKNIEFLMSPNDDQLPPDLSEFHLVLLNAVYEHLLPRERRILTTKLWDAVKPGGCMLVTETPYRWFPIETHTTGLPLINYLPKAAAAPMARRFSFRVKNEEPWHALLRRGIRGATVKEVYKILKSHDPHAQIMQPRPGIKSPHQIWLEAASERNMKTPMKLAVKSCRFLTAKTGLGVSPYICFAVQKGNAASNA
ncbi:class I SAM-dependent methyltransferase [Desulfatibacillum aliphaticivorans]|uniref:class I SAM-dependent methyltransferase n=1 Tax=Desulfatibacillum aliphaticivorans TaxID=218208 RepID=UPI00041FA033|nr:class I SAM-dependent methyltransferase [Desulfatibacillum aliphaticivorans]